MKIDITGSGAIGLAYSNRYWNATEPFSHAKFGGYLVTRLDGYTEADAKALTSRALEAEQGLTNGKVLFDVQPIFGLGDKTTQPAPITGTVILRESPWGEYNADMQRAHDLLVKRGILDELDLREKFVGQRTNCSVIFRGAATTPDIPAAHIKHSFLRPVFKRHRRVNLRRTFCQRRWTIVAR